jgi:parallel beta-helix repeat protein
MRRAAPAIFAAAALAAGCLVTIDRDKIGATDDADGSVPDAAADGSLPDAAPPPPCLDEDPTNTIVCPGESIQAAVDANGWGAEITIKAGVHREQTVAPKAGNTFTGEPGSVLSGARELTLFEQEGQLWFAAGQSQAGQPDQGACRTGTGNETGLFENWPRCTHPEDLYFDEVPLRHVASLSEVAAGSWFFDYDADRIYFADDPSGRKVETSVTRMAFDGVNHGAQDVTIRGLVIEKYASSTQGATIQVSNCKNWVIENNELRLNHAAAIGGGPCEGMILRGNHVHHNGSGIALYQPTGALVENNLVENNGEGWPGYVAPHYTSGIGMLGAIDPVIRSNQVLENAAGIRLTATTSSYLVDKNRLERNQSHGIELRTSCSGIVSLNEIHDNGQVGILVQRSQAAEIFGNNLSGNGSTFYPSAHPWATPYQFMLTETAQVFGEPCSTIANVSVHDNTLTISGALGAVDAAVAGGFLFSKNTYDLKAASAKPFRLLGVAASEIDWKAAGQDTDGTFLR